MKIAVIGAGTAGLAAAAFLKRSGHDVTLYEKFDSPRPLGAGLMLQPTGLAVLARLGLDKQAIAMSSRIEGIDGRVVGTGRIIFRIGYAMLSRRMFGLGIHRNTLFLLLYEKVLAEQVPVVNAASIDDVRYNDDGLPLIVAGERSFGPFELVVNAQGARSVLRSKFAWVRKDKPYPYAAVWGVCRDTQSAFKDWLMQRYQKAHHMIGVMPMGRLNGDTCESVAFFWSLRAQEHEQWRARGIEAWKAYVVSLWPEVEPLVQQFQSVDELNYATYGDVHLRRVHANRLVFIGDAAHATSPQLGQGANLGLLDALTLDECLADTSDVNAALEEYARRRKSHVRFYQKASHWLTPFFQSDSRFRPWLRDRCLGMMCKLPFLKTQMIRTLSGTKTGLFTHMNPGTIHPDYDLRG